MISRPVARLPDHLLTPQCRLLPIRASRCCVSTLVSNPNTILRHHSSSSSSTRWKTRQSADPYTKAAALSTLKSRAAFKLLEINAKHRLFRPGQTVVDLGYAPGSWSQVAISKTQPGGRVVGIDVIPALPPKGVSTLQGDFLSEGIRAQVRDFVQEEGRGRVREGRFGGVEGVERDAFDTLATERRDMEAGDGDGEGAAVTQKERDRRQRRVVDVVLSDMSEPWPLGASTWIRSVSNPHRRMMNTSGMGFRDHAGSMNLCQAALTFTYDTLKTGGHFLCKFYQGSEDHALELRLRKLFEKVHRIKPESSRKESKEAYLLGLRRKAGVHRRDVLGEEEGGAIDESEKG